MFGSWRGNSGSYTSDDSNIDDVRGRRQTTEHSRDIIVASDFYDTNFVYAQLSYLHLSDIFKYLMNKFGYLQISGHRRTSHHHRHVGIKHITIKPSNVLLKTLLNVLLINTDDN